MIGKQVEVLSENPNGGISRDRYSDAVAWEVTDRGDLMVLRGGASVEATYPFGEWKRVRWVASS